MSLDPITQNQISNLVKEDRAKKVADEKIGAELPGDENATTDAKLRMLHEKIITLKERIDAVQGNVEEVHKQLTSTLNVLQKLLGIQLTRSPSGDQIGLRVISPKKNQGNPGVLADMFFKMQTLWKKHQDKRIITLDGANGGRQ